jgi:hypothetical protein
MARPGSPTGVIGAVHSTLTMGSSLSVAEQSLVEANDSPLRRLSGATPVAPEDKLWTRDLDQVRFAMGDLDAQGLQAVMDLVCEQMGG